ncbi:uncharacterized protein BCR38DRAFT_53280 [Pseudomassariella vexata]|uniref:Uncharacterized protein n=1 Tax=Pseudomassariella vexata TaxID=1141098 RepID=A0A1Y2DLC2_9PEZI|nr:uncharacterized protein BCR38DRAFT_53280 [Pseudomassariella vexata]ORY60080.1 hypothetical protein BCR38DRAFT_53280 [Pseudomassariella vexata]
MSSKTVKFGGNTASRTSRRSNDYDSGLAQDREDQRLNIRALQEALDEANWNIAKHKQRYQEYEGKIAEANKKLRESEAHRRGLCERNETLEQDNKACREQIKVNKADYDDLRLEAAELRQRLLHYESGHDHTAPPMMSGGSGDSTASRWSDTGRSKSKPASDGMHDRLKERINKPTEAKSGRTRRPSVSVTTQTKDIYIEKVPPETPSRSHSRYSTARPGPPAVALMNPPIVSNIRHSTYSAADYQQSGDYEQYPLPDHTGRTKHTYHG